MSSRTLMSKCRQAGDARMVGLAAAVTAVLIAVSAAPALAGTLTHSSSERVALIPQAGPVPAQGPNGIMPTSSYVSGRPSESFSRFSFRNLPLNQVTAANLAQYDTIALIQVSTSSLTASEKTAIAQFVAGGGKLIIHDADETNANDYSWLLPDGSNTTHIGQGCNNCGSSSGSSTITADSGIISDNPFAPSYVNISQLYQFTDQGDANLLVSTDPRWFSLAHGNNGRGESGSQVAYADNDGLIIYNGFDTDFIKSRATDSWRCNDVAIDFACPPPSAPQPAVDWLAQMWYSELAQGWGQSSPPPTRPGGQPALPTNQPVIGVGNSLPPGAAGLPPARGSNPRCVARADLLLRISSLLHLGRRKIVQVDVYVNGRHIFRERRPFTSRTLRGLPRHRRFTVMVIATTTRGYHLIAKRRYRRC